MSAADIVRKTDVHHLDIAGEIPARRQQQSQFGQTGGDRHIGGHRHRIDPAVIP